MGTRRAVSPVEWVKLAASRDVARPVLTGVYVNQRHMVATDGHRLHVAPVAGLTEGLWHWKSGEPIDGKYPDYEGVTPASEPNYALLGEDRQRVDELLAAAIVAQRRAKTPRAARAYPVALPVGADGFAAVNPAYLADALSLMDWRVPVAFSITGPEKPIKIDFGADAYALLMPMRVHEITRHFDLRDYFTAVDAERAA